MGIGLCVCVCTCECACVRACVRACVCVCVCVRVRVAEYSMYMVRMSSIIFITMPLCAFEIHVCTHFHVNGAVTLA